MCLQGTGNKSFLRWHWRLMQPAFTVKNSNSTMNVSAAKHSRRPTRCCSVQAPLCVRTRLPFAGLLFFYFLDTQGLQFVRKRAKSIGLPLQHERRSHVIPGGLCSNPIMRQSLLLSKDLCVVRSHSLACHCRANIIVEKLARHFGR